MAAKKNNKAPRWLIDANKQAHRVTQVDEDGSNLVVWFKVGRHECHAIVSRINAHKVLTTDLG